MAVSDVVVPDDVGVEVVLDDEVVVIEVVCVLVLVVIDEVVVFDVVCVVVYADEEVVKAEVLVAPDDVCVVLLPDEQLNAIMLTSIVRAKITTKKQRRGFK